MGDIPPYVLASAIIGILIGASSGAVIFLDGKKKALDEINLDVCLNAGLGSIGFFIIGFAVWLPVLLMSPIFGLILYARHLLLKRKAS